MDCSSEMQADEQPSEEQAKDQEEETKNNFEPASVSGINDFRDRIIDQGEGFDDPVDNLVNHILDSEMDTSTQAVNMMSAFIKEPEEASDYSLQPSDL